MFLPFTHARSESIKRGMVSSVLGHFGLWSFRSFFEDRNDQGPNWLSHYGPKDRTAHQKDRSAHALRQTGIGVRMHMLSYAN